MKIVAITGSPRENGRTSAIVNEIVNVFTEDVDSARKILNELPIVNEKLIAFNFYPIGAFTGWEAIFKDSE